MKQAHNLPTGTKALREIKRSLTKRRKRSDQESQSVKRHAKRAAISASSKRKRRFKQKLKNPKVGG